MSYLKRDIKYPKTLRIGIYADSFNGKTGVTTPYMNFVKLFGKPVLITSDDSYEDVEKKCDVIISPGGADVDSIRYKEAPHPTNSRSNMHYEWIDYFILSPWIESGKPVLGICRGMQSINVLMGGTLFQNISGHLQSADRAVTRELTRVEYVDGEVGFPYVNTFHHQAVKDLGEGLIPFAFCPVYKNCESLEFREKLYTKEFPVIKDKKEEMANWYAICEAYVHPTLPILGVQWHPEEFNCPITINMFDNILNNYYK